MGENLQPDVPMHTNVSAKSEVRGSAASVLNQFPLAAHAGIYDPSMPVETRMTCLTTKKVHVSSLLGVALVS